MTGLYLKCQSQSHSIVNSQRRLNKGVGIQRRSTFLFTQAGPRGVPKKTFALKTMISRFYINIIYIYGSMFVSSWHTHVRNTLGHFVPTFSPSQISSSRIPKLNLWHTPFCYFSSQILEILISYPSCKDLREEVKHWLEAFKSRPGYNLQRPPGFDLKLTIMYHRVYNLQRALEACDFRLDEDDEDWLCCRSTNSWLTDAEMCK